MGIEIDESKLSTSILWNEDDLSILNSPTYIEGLDEVAEVLGVGHDMKGYGLMLVGKKGSYSLVNLMNAHIAMMKKVLEVSK